MGILNVTPDSFSDGGSYFQSSRAIERGLHLAAQGADIVDVGGESTRPGAAPLPQAVEAARVLPVIRELVREGVSVSIDTMHAETARSALGVGACAVNDVSGGLADPGMAACLAETGAPYVVMHWRGPSASMQRRASYGNVVEDVVNELARRLDGLAVQGVHRDQTIIDPGIGFGKTAAHNWSLLSHLEALRGLNRPIMIGASRKAFLGELLVRSDGTVAPPSQRDEATAAISALVAAAGAYCVRVHEVAASVAAVKVAAGWREPLSP